MLDVGCRARCRIAHPSGLFSARSARNLTSTMPSPAGSGRREHVAAIIVATVFAALAWTGWSNERAEGDPATSVPTAADAALPVDPAVMIDSLPNGLRYYVRENRNPKNAIELRLVVDAGSLLERDDQRGLAHGVEHM